MDYGSRIESIPLLISGKIKIYKEDEDENELFLYYIHPGQGCAVSFSCYQKLSTVRAQIEEDATVIAIPVEEMDNLTLNFPSWNRFVLSIYNQRFEEVLETLNEIAFHKLDERLIDYLEKQSFALNTRDLNITHAQIASELNTSREVISRLLKKFEQNKLIEMGRHKITLKD